eukprot:366006-Chlamydomonas_euryale.AAC.2
MVNHSGWTERCIRMLRQRCWQTLRRACLRCVDVWVRGSRGLAGAPLGRPGGAGGFRVMYRLVHGGGGGIQWLRVEVVYVGLSLCMFGRGRQLSSSTFRQQPPCGSEDIAAGPRACVGGCAAGWGGVWGFGRVSGCGAWGRCAKIGSKRFLLALDSAGVTAYRLSNERSTQSALCAACDQHASRRELLCKCGASVEGMVDGWVRARVRGLVGSWGRGGAKEERIFATRRGAVPRVDELPSGCCTSCHCAAHAAALRMQLRCTCRCSMHATALHLPLLYACNCAAHAAALCMPLRCTCRCSTHATALHVPLLYTCLHAARASTLRMPLRCTCDRTAAHTPLPAAQRPQAMPLRDGERASIQAGGGTPPAQMRYCAAQQRFVCDASGPQTPSHPSGAPLLAVTTPLLVAPRHRAKLRMQARSCCGQDACRRRQPATCAN